MDVHCKQLKVHEKSKEGKGARVFPRGQAGSATLITDVAKNTKKK